MNDRAFALQIRAENAEEHRKNVEHLKAEAEYLNECATDRFESRGWPPRVTLDCECQVERLEGRRLWTLCPRHESMGVEP